MSPTFPWSSRLKSASFRVIAEGTGLAQSTGKMFVHHIPDVSTEIGEHHTPGTQVLGLGGLRLFAALLFPSILLLLWRKLRLRTGLQRSRLLILAAVRGKLLRILHSAVGTELLLLKDTDLFSL